jgi:hypothetical protein
VPAANVFSYQTRKASVGSSGHICHTMWDCVSHLNFSEPFPQGQNSGLQPTRDQGGLPSSLVLFVSACVENGDRR